MPHRRPRAATVGLGALVAGLVVAGAACDDVGDGAATADSPPSTVEEGPVAATAVAVGDCLTGIVLGTAEHAEVASADVVSCDRSHDLEVFATFSLRPTDFELAEPGDYPGRVRVVRAADAGCTERLTATVGESADYGLIALWPSQASWASGDRSVACAVFAPDGASFEGREL